MNLENVATKQDVRELRLELTAELQRFKADLLKWLVLLLLGQTALIVALVKLI